MTDKLSGRVGVVTGGANGIGAATSTRMAAEGARVVVADLDGDGAEAVAAELRSGGAEAVGVRADVTSDHEVAAMISTAIDTWGRIDILHNNAGTTAVDIVSRDAGLHEMETDLWDLMMAVNLRGPMFAIKHAVPHFVAQGSGSIVNTSSAASLAGDALYAAYGAAKAGLNSLTRSVATQYGKQGVRCNAIAPGVVASPNLFSHFDPELLRIYRSNHLTPELGSPEEVAAVAVFLASDDASFVTGQILAVDGGLLAHLPTWAQLHQS